MPDPDQKTLELWGKYDAAPDEPRPVSFWFYFPHEQEAKLAKNVLKKDGFEVDISAPDSAKDKWLCLAYKTMVPEYAELSDLRKWMQKLADGLNGDYDGWETELIQ